MNNKFTKGATYRVGHIDTTAELIPQTSSFKARPNEQHIFEPKPNTATIDQVWEALEQGQLTDLDKTLISIIAVFASATCTTRALSEMLILQGTSASKNVIESSIKRLHRYNLINLSRFQNENGTQPSLRIITLTIFGSQLVEKLEVPHRFNPKATASAEPHQVKSRTETTHLICNWLKQLPVESFEVRPVIVINPKDDAIIRPAATITLWGEKLFFEVPRRHEGWLEDITDKLHRYTKVFAGKPLPTVIINGEDIRMNHEIYEALNNSGYPGEVLFTEDTAMFGTAFRTCLYTFNESNVIKFAFNEPETQAV